MTELVKKLLSETSLNSFADSTPGRGHLASVTTSATIGEAIKVLSDNKVLSIPVLADGGEYAGCLSVADVLKALVKGLSVFEEGKNLLDEKWVSHNEEEAMKQLTDVIGPQFTQSTVESILHDGDLWFKSDAGSTLLEVIKEGFRIDAPQDMVAREKVHHRIAVCSKTSGATNVTGLVSAFSSGAQFKVETVVSHSDVVKFIHSHMEELGPIFQKSVGELDLVQDAETCWAGTPALAAFCILYRHRRSSLGVTAAPGKGAPLLANLSVSDLRGLTPETFGLLALPVGEYLSVRSGKGPTPAEALQGEFPDGAEDGNWEKVLKDLPAISATAESSLADVINVLVDMHLHRVYIIDPTTQQAVGIITLTDVLRLLTK